MKVLRLSTAYPEYLVSFFKSRPGLEKKKYEDQHQALMYDSFGWADFWKNALHPLGYEVEDVVANAESLQKAWARENGIPYEDRDWFLGLARARICSLQPDILFINDYVSFRREWIEEIRRECPSLRLILGWCGAPYPDPEVFKSYDAVLSCVPELVEDFQARGHKSYHLNHAFDPRILDSIASRQSVSLGFTFVGQINRQSGFHRERERFLIDLLDRTPLKIYSMNHRAGAMKYIMAIGRKTVYAAHTALSHGGVPDTLLDRIPVVSRGPLYRDHPLLPVHPHLRKHLRSPVFGLDMFQVLRDSEVTFNSHLAISTHSSSNMRMFEATGVGTCLLTDHKEKTSRLFEPDSEVVTYRSSEECCEKALYLLHNPEQRDNIAEAAQRRTLSEHTYGRRAHDLDRIIREILE